MSTRAGFTPTAHPWKGRATTVCALHHNHGLCQAPRRTLALAAAGALTLAGLGAINAAPAGAVVLTANAGTLQWGIKSSLLNYHVALHAGTTQGITQGEGATASTTTRGSGAETYPAFWTFPFVSGSYDTTTTKYTAQYAGFVALTESNPAATSGPGQNTATNSSPFKYFKLSNPKVIIDLAAGTKQLVLDVQEGPETGPAAPSGPISEDVDFATFPTLAAAATPAGDVLTYTNVAAAFTEVGSAAFGGFYGAGTEMDPVTTSLTAPSGGGSSGGSTSGGGSSGGSTSGGGSSGGSTSGGGSSGGSTGSGSGINDSTSTSNPGAPGANEDSVSEAVDPLPLTGIPEPAPDASVTAPRAPLDGQAVAIGVAGVRDSATGGELALFGVAALAALVMALVVSLFLRYRREDLQA